MPSNRDESHLNDGISFGEDPLSTYSSPNTSGCHSTSSNEFATAIQSSATSASSQEDESFDNNAKLLYRQRSRKISIKYLLPWTWFYSNPNEMLISKIMKNFNENNVDEMKKYLEPATTNSSSLESEVTSPPDGQFYFNEEMEYDDLFSDPIAYTLKKKDPVQSRLIKAVRFAHDTPEDNVGRKRMFTPLITSTPRDVEMDENSDQEEISSLHQCDSNTVVIPQSLLKQEDKSGVSFTLRNHSVLNSLNVTHQKAVDLALDSSRAKSHYRIYYDDTDEEEVENDDVSSVTLNGTIESDKSIDIGCGETYTVLNARNDSVSPATPRPTMDDSFVDMNVSVDSSIHLGFERLDDYLQSLETEIAVHQKLANEKNITRSEEAWKRVKYLSDRVDKIKDAICKIVQNFGDFPSSLNLNESMDSDNDKDDVRVPSDYDYIANGDDGNEQNENRPEEYGIETKAFDDSCWADRNEIGGSSCDSSELHTMDNWIE